MKLYVIRDDGDDVAICTTLDEAMPLMFEYMKQVEGNRNEHPDYDEGEWETETVMLVETNANCIGTEKMMCIYRQGKDGFFLNVLVDGNKRNHYDENGNLICVRESKMKGERK